MISNPVEKPFLIDEHIEDRLHTIRCSKCGAHAEAYDKHHHAEAEAAMPFEDLVREDLLLQRWAHCKCNTEGMNYRQLTCPPDCLKGKDTMKDLAFKREPKMKR